MKFDYVCMAGLPPLAWSAAIHRNSNRVVVYHGTGIETHRQFFVEGAWDGEFTEGNFDTALTFSGSGGRLRSDRSICFSSASNNLERLYELNRGHEYLISNSLVMLLTASGKEPDPSYPNYFLDYTRFYRVGIRTFNKFIPCASGAKSGL